jgi:hypothetical protein
MRAERAVEPTRSENASARFALAHSRLGLTSARQGRRLVPEMLEPIGRQSGVPVDMIERCPEIGLDGASVMAVVVSLNPQACRSTGSRQESCFVEHDPHHLISPSGLTADVGEPQELEGLRLIVPDDVVGPGLLTLTGNASDAIQAITTAVTALRSTGATLWMPLSLIYLTKAYFEVGQFDDAWRSIGEAVTIVEATEERWCEAEVNRVAGEIALKSLGRDVDKAEAYFERALAIARQQQAKSWELRAAMCMARLWRDQGKREEARDLLAPVYGWFTEGFDTLDLKEAKALLDELA